jgi:hypothetical protein
MPSHIQSGPSCHESALPLLKAGSDRSVVALKRHACDFMGQPRTSGDQQMTNDDAGPSYLEEVDKYEYDTLAISRMITW